MMQIASEDIDQETEQLRAWMLEFQARHSLRPCDMACLLRRTPEWYSRIKKSGPVPEILIDYLRLIDSLSPERQLIIFQGDCLPQFHLPKVQSVAITSDKSNLDHRAAGIAVRFIKLLEGRTESELDRLDNQVQLMEMKAGIPLKTNPTIHTWLSKQFLSEQCHSRLEADQ